MSKFRVRNIRDQGISLPTPYSGIIPPGEAAILEGTEAEIVSNLGGEDSIAGVLRIEAAKDSEATTYHNTGGSTKLLRFVDPVAAGTAVHAAVQSNDATEFPGPFTNPAEPRTLQCDFAASYDGGDVTIDGTNQFDEPVSETIVAAAGSTVQGSKIFKTVTAARHAAVGATTNTVDLEVGDGIGILERVKGDFALLSVAGTGEAVTVSSAENSFVPTTAPDGSADFDLLVNV